ncbi:hypothetical protein HK097_000274 [Rhizophlyctis rosea]|uniref:Uncharacterized protein n=1 Tax=Rhizophlyctis rosea TaxID=64517 RepID=A0AAD5S8A3_9FUNG|nr:hypothetical protein HK097_000274 [Rhizophlyctis rosea]
MAASYYKYIKTFLQLITLILVLATWSNVDKLFGAVKVRQNTFHVFFGPPVTPKQIHVGEVYNATLQWEANMRTRKTYLNVTMLMGLKCPGGRDSGKTWTIRDWIIQHKDGSLYFQYPITEEDLNPSYTEGLCYLNIDYTYHANTDIPTTSSSTSNPLYTTKKDRAMSAVFKITTAPRILPLPIYSPANILPPAERILALQLRTMKKVVNEDGTWIYAEEDSRPRVERPLVRSYGYGIMSIWPEDDEEWVLDEAVRWGTIFAWVGVVAALWGVMKVERVRRVVDGIRDGIAGWFLQDIEDPLMPKRTGRRRLFSRSLPTHAAHPARD